MEIDAKMLRNGKLLVGLKGAELSCFSKPHPDTGEMEFLWGIGFQAGIHETHMISTFVEKEQTLVLEGSATLMPSVGRLVSTNDYGVEKWFTAANADYVPRGQQEVRLQRMEQLLQTLSQENLAMKRVQKAQVQVMKNQEVKIDVVQVQEPEAVEQVEQEPEAVEQVEQEPEAVKDPDALADAKRTVSDAD